MKINLSGFPLLEIVEVHYKEMLANARALSRRGIQDLLAANSFLSA